MLTERHGEADLTALEAWLKTASRTIFLATEESVANDISRKLVESADAISDLRRKLDEAREVIRPFAAPQNPQALPRHFEAARRWMEDK